MKQHPRTMPKTLFTDKPHARLKHGDVVSCTAHAQMYFLWDGAVRTYRVTHDGKELTTGLYVAESHWVLICVSGDYNAFEALKPTEYIRAGCQDVAQALAGHPDTLANIFSQILNSFEEAFQTQEDLAFRDVTTRLAHMLLILGEKFGEPGDDGTTITLKLPQDKLAAMISSSRPSVNIALKTLAEAKIIALDKGKITLLAPQKLAEIG